MAKGFKHGAGGASLLNFKVMGGTSAPSNPKENTIWVNTNTEITGWQFASDDPNLLDVNAWANNTPVANGSKSVSGNSISITADSTGNAYTHWSGQYALAYANIPCEPGKTYVLEWDHTGGDGRAMIFPYATTTGSKSANASAGKLEYTPADGVSYFTFRFDSRTVNGTATYSNIRITEKERAFESGAVWFQTVTSSSAKFNALKKNSIQVYPLSAKQYINGAWVNKEAKSYIGGAWVEWVMYLYNMGNECKGLTGGWQTRAWRHSSGAAFTAIGEPTITKNADSMTITFSPDGSGVAEVVKDINFSGRKTLYCNIKSLVGANDPYATAELVIVPRNATYYSGDSVALSMITTTGIIALNIENLDAGTSYDVAIGGQAKYDKTYSVTVDKIWCE